jgi:hypothetical protein
MLEMWFGKTFNREGLDAKTRLLVTMAALTVLGRAGRAATALTIRQALEAGRHQARDRGSDLSDEHVRRAARHAEGA